jgi:type I restriction enzyme S subunit
MIQLPKDWTEKPFSQVARYTTGRTPARANAIYWESGANQVPWVAISDMEEYGTITKTAETVSVIAFQDVFRERIVPAGTLLMSFKLTIGRITTLGIPACHNEAIISIYPRDGVEQRFLGYYLSQVNYSDHQDRQVKGNTLNQSKIDRIPVLLPPDNEQRSIADVLDLCRVGINTERTAETTTTELKQSAMRELFTRGLRGEAQKETEIGLAPESWKLESLGTHHSVVSGGTPSRSNPAYWSGGTIPWVKTTEVNYCVINETEEHITQLGLESSAAKLLPTGTLLMAMYGQGVTRGKVAALGIEAACNQACAAITATDEAISPRYLYYFLNWRYEAIRSLAHGGQQQNLNLEIVRDLSVAYPQTESEQHEIVAILDAIDRKIALHRQKRAVLEELFKSLLHKLMTGAIRASDFDLSALNSSEAAYGH